MNLKRFLAIQAPEMSFCERLDYFMDLRDMNPNVLENKSVELNNKGFSYSTYRKYKRGDLKNPNKSTLLCIAEVLDIHPKHLFFDVGRYWRSRALRIYKGLNLSYDGEPRNKNGELCLHGLFEFDIESDFDNRWIKLFDFSKGGSSTFKGDAFENINSEDDIDYLYTEGQEYLETDNRNLDEIEDLIEEMDLYELYKFNLFKDSYINISDNEWDLLVLFSGLSIESKKTFLEFTMDLMCGETEYHISNNPLSEKLEKYKKINQTTGRQLSGVFDENTKAKKDNQVRIDISNDIFTYIGNNSKMISTTCERMKDIVTMDFMDWNLIIYYNILSNKFTKDKSYIYKIFAYKMKKLHENNDK